MKKILYFFPVGLDCIIYIFLGVISSFGSINPFVWLSLILLFISGLLVKI